METEEAHRSDLLGIKLYREMKNNDQDIRINKIGAEPYLEITESSDPHFRNDQGAIYLKEFCRLALTRGVKVTKLERNKLRIEIR